MLYLYRLNTHYSHDQNRLYCIEIGTSEYWLVSRGSYLLDYSCALNCSETSHGFQKLSSFTASFRTTSAINSFILKPSIKPFQLCDRNNTFITKVTAKTAQLLGKRSVSLLADNHRDATWSRSFAGIERSKGLFDPLLRESRANIAQVNLQTEAAIKNHHVVKRSLK